MQDMSERFEDTPQNFPNNSWVWNLKPLILNFYHTYAHALLFRAMHIPPFYGKKQTAWWPLL